MAFSFDEVLVEVSKQLFSDNARVVKIGTHRYPIQRSHKGHLRQVRFLFEGHDVRVIEQNPGANNRWAALVRSGKKVAQFLSDGRYVASVAFGDSWENPAASPQDTRRCVMPPHGENTHPRLPKH